MTTQTQLEIDLHNEARDRLKKWADGTLMRLTAADLEDRAKRVMLISLALELLFVCLPGHTTRKDFLILMEVMFDHSEKFGGHSPNRSPNHA